MKSATIKITIAGMFLTIVGVAAYTLLSRLSDQTLSAIAGAAAVLTVAVIMGMLFIVRDAMQARLLRRQLAQDDFDDLKRAALVFRLMNGRAPSVNVKVPEQSPPGQAWPFLLPGAPQSQLPDPWRYDGAYRDTTLGSDVELE
jgi:hypothetical protein